MHDNTPNKFPKISIITPSYNQGKYLEKTIKSVLDQNYPNLEYIILDGGSTDQSVEIIKKYERQLSHWVSEKDNGQSHALNKGFAKATGEIIAWINADDWYEKNTFKIVVDMFSKPGVCVVAGNCKMVYEGAPEQNFVDRPGDINFRRMIQFWKLFFCPPQPSIFFKNEVLKNVGLIDESLTYGMDLDLWLRISGKYKFYYVDELLSNYLIHSASKSGSSNGFEKFVPEWEKVINTHVSKTTLLNKFFYWNAKRKSNQ